MLNLPAYDQERILNFGIVTSSLHFQIILHTVEYCVNVIRHLSAGFGFAVPDFDANKEFDWCVCLRFDLCQFVNYIGPDLEFERGSIRRLLEAHRV